MTRTVRLGGAALLLLVMATRLGRGAAFFHPVPEPSAIQKDLAYTRADGKDVVMDVYRPSSAPISGRCCLEQRPGSRGA